MSIYDATKETNYWTWLNIIISIVIITTVTACEDQLVPQMDNIIKEGVDPLENIPRIDFQDSIKQEQINGPYLWLASYAESFHTLDQATDEDVISNVTNGAVSEMDIATQGINPYIDIENFNWTLGTLFGEPNGPYNPHNGANNIGELVSAEGLTNNRSSGYKTIYGLLSIVSDKEYSATMKVGSDDSIKIWLNGEVVHINPIARPTIGFQETVQVVINKGDNLLLVKVTDSGGHWAMFLGLEQTDIAKYLGDHAAEPTSLIPRVTTDNALDLTPGLYMLRPTGIAQDSIGRDQVIDGLFWGTISPEESSYINGFVGNESGWKRWTNNIGGFPTDAPKILLYIDLKPRIYARLLDGNWAIWDNSAHNTVPNEIVVKIVSKIDEGQAQGGPRFNKFDFDYVAYEAVVLGNLTHPDIVFETE